MLNAIIAMLVLAGTASVVPSAAPEAQQTCPADQWASRKLVERFLTFPRYATERQGSGLSGFTMSQVRVLTDAQDLTMCQRIVSMYGHNGSHPNWQWSAYRIGTRTVVSWRYVNTDGRMRLGYTPLIVLDANGTRIAGYAM